MGDTASALGAAAAGMSWPMALTDILVANYLTGGKFPSPFKTKREKDRDAIAKASAEEIERAAESMSPVFSSLYGG